jgi:MarR family transcriptional regulator, temperature-dependent positive regulator of motility
MHKPLQVRDDYLDIRFLATAERTRERGSLTYESKCDVSIREITLLRIIANSPGITMGELVLAASVEKTTASKLVSGLVNNGLIVRHVGTEDARQIQLALTDEGISLVKVAIPLGQALEDRFLACLTATEIQTLKRILQKLNGTHEEPNQYQPSRPEV